MKNLEQENPAGRTGIIPSFQREVSHIFQRVATIGTRLSLTLAVLAASEYAFTATAFAQRKTPPPDTSDIPLYPTEKSILNPPNINGSDEERRQWITAVQRYGLLADSLDISGCEANPPSFIVPIGQPEISISNSDDQEHDLYLGGVLRFPVPANGTTTFDTSFFQEDFRGSAAFYAYTCDVENAATPAGLLYVVRVIDNPQ